MLMMRIGMSITAGSAAAGGGGGGGVGGTTGGGATEGGVESRRVSPGSCGRVTSSSGILSVIRARRRCVAPGEESRFPDRDGGARSSLDALEGPGVISDVADGGPSSGTVVDGSTAPGAGAARRSSLMPSLASAPARSARRQARAATDRPRASRRAPRPSSRGGRRRSPALARPGVTDRTRDHRAERRGRRCRSVVMRPTIMATTITTVTRPSPPSASISMATRRLRAKRFGTWRIPMALTG